jgi:hypothetical protein
MSRSIFDPTSGSPEHSGNRFTPPDADQVSHLPEQFSNPTSANVSGEVGFTPPPESAALQITSENDGKLLAVKMTGKLHKEDYRHFVPTVEAAVQRHGKVRMLVQMQNFHGWSAGALWEDMKFDLKHFNHIERLAIVGETTWEKWMAVFCKPFTTATIRYFPAEDLAAARAWIAAA